jgi:hypothetical protein
MDMKFSKAVAFPLLLMVTLGVTGSAYAWWTKTLNIAGTATTGELKVEFVNGQAPGKDWNKPNWRTYGAASYVTRTWSWSSDKLAINITLGNMYPGTGSQRFAFGIRNTGSIPAKLKDITVSIIGDPTTAHYIRTQGKIEYCRSDLKKVWEKSFGNWPHIDNDAYERDIPLENLEAKLDSLLAGTVLYPGEFLGFGEDEGEEAGSLGFAMHATAPESTEGQTLTVTITFSFEQWNAL